MRSAAGSKQKETEAKRRKKRNTKAKISYNADIQIKLFELLQGDRKVVNIYSRKLDCKICLVNPALVNPNEVKSPYPVYTTNELAFILSFDAEELRRFHYLKTRLVE